MSTLGSPGWILIKADVVRRVAAHIAHFAVLKRSKCHWLRVSILKYAVISLYCEVAIKNHVVQVTVSHGNDAKKHN